jgi:tRNA (guanine-N7-)-methyltransferase
LLSHDAVEVLDDMIPGASLDRVQLYFPDPWHKKRHHKRRIVNAGFRDRVARVLKPGGLLHMATDWQDYAEHMAAEMLADDRFENLGNERGYAPQPAWRPETRFERRGRRLGHGVWDLLFRKRPRDEALNPR